MLYFGYFAYPSSYAFIIPSRIAIYGNVMAAAGSNQAMKQVAGAANLGQNYIEPGSGQYGMKAPIGNVFWGLQEAPMHLITPQA